MVKKGILPVVLSLCVFLPLSSPTARGQVQKGWRSIGALHDARGGEQVQVRVDRAEKQALELTYAMPGLTSAKAGRRINGQEQEQLLLGNAPRTGQPGQPVLPVVPARILIPEGYTVDSIRVTSRGKTKLSGAHVVEYGEKPFPLVPGARPEEAKPDPSIYNSSNPYPGKLYDVIGIQKQRGSAVLLVALHPVEYVPVTGELSWYGELTLRVTLKPENSRGNVRYRDDVQRPVTATVDNPDTAATYSEARTLDSGLAALGGVDSSNSYAYVIVTGEEMRNATGPYALTNLLAHKQSCGLTATIVTMTEIATNYTGVDNAEKLRNFIIDAYNNWETDYVLLAGDTSIVPMRKLRCTASGETDDIPSDLYYQCLDGPYNNDGDGYWGEPTDGAGGGDVDLVAEVYIGRASAENTNEMANFVYKTLAYEQDTETAEYLHTALMCGEHLGFGGDSEYAWPSMEEIRCGSDSAGYTTVGFTNSPLFNVETLYDTTTNTWAKADLLDKINSGRYSIINHLGHANYNYVMKFYNDDADGLTNNHFLFAYSQGCIPGNFEENCVAEHLTTSTRHGMFAVVFNSRYGWGTYNSTDGPSQRFDRQFWDAYFGEKMMSIGALNADSHEDNLWDLDGACIRWCYYESNLLGDPQTPMRGQFISDAIIVTPNAGFLPSGAEGGPFSPPAQTYYLFGTATNGTLDWTATCTSSWVSLSATNGTLSESGHASLTLTINTNAELLAEGEYFDTFVFLNATTGKGSVTQEVHLVVNNPPRVSALSIQDGDCVAAGDTSITIAFDQAMNTTTLNQADFELRGEIGGVRPPASWSYDNAMNELTLNYPALADDQYTLLLFSGDGQFEDAEGFNLDGETPSWPIPTNFSGNGVAGGNLVISFEADAGVIPYAAVFAPEPPFGSLVYDASMRANLSSAADEDGFTMVLDADQTVTLVVIPGPGLQPVVRLYGLSGAEIGAVTATAAGADAVLQSAEIPVMGTYTAVVAAAGAAGGIYTLQVVLNAAQEVEEHGGPTNDTVTVAQDLDGAFTSLSGGVSRAAVIGYAARGPLEVIYEQTFEGGLGGFVTNNSYGSGNGLWHLSTGRQSDSGHSSSHSVYYGHNEGASGGGDYDTSTANGGEIRSPSISLPDCEDLTLSFNMFSETEGSKYWDACAVDVGVDGRFGSLLSPASGNLPTGTGGVWTNITADLQSYRGTSVTLRFTFETFDSVLNNYEGWYVDDVRITTYDEGLPDCYSFTLAAGEPVTLALAVLGRGAMVLRLCDGAGVVLAEGAAGQRNVSASIDRFVAPSTGTYVAQVSGGNQAYSLVVIRAGDFDREPNQPLGGAQGISNRLVVLGSLAAAPLASEIEPNDDGQRGFSTNDLAAANDWSGGFVQTGPGLYEATVSGFVSAGWNADRDLFKFYASPGDSVSARVDCVSVQTYDFTLYDHDGNELDVYDYNSDKSVQYTNFSYSGDYYLEVKLSGSTSALYEVTGALKTTNIQYGVEDDDYAFQVTAGDLLTLRTFTPGDGSGEFRNDLDPIIELYSPEGLLVATNDNGAADGRNGLMSYRAVMDGAHVARLRAAGVCGEYVFAVDREAGPPVVTFGAGTCFGFESGSVVVLPVLLSAATSETVTVNYGVAGGTASGGGVDYTLVPGTLTFPPGVTETSLVISIHNDSSVEGTETILVGLSNVVHALPGRYPTNQVVIVDDENPLCVGFSAASYGVQETSTSAVITVTRAGGNNGCIMVDYAATNGTAAAGTDYTPVTGTVVIADGAGSASFGVPVEFDVIEEPNETVALSLGNPRDGVILGSQSNATLTIYDYKYPRTNMFRNAGFETPATTNAFSDGWWAYGLVTREDWAAHSGRRGGNFQGWMEWEYGHVEQDVDTMRGTYTFSLWVRREAGFNPYSLSLRIDWYDSSWAQIQETTESPDLSDVIPADGGWHHVYLTGACMNPALDHVEVEIYSLWGSPTSSPSGFMFDDAAFYGGSYTGVPALANGGFEEGLSSGDKWRGSSWYATPENVANTRENWVGGWHSGLWGGALYGWDSASNRYTTTIAQNVMPGTGTYTLAFWLLREPGFLLNSAELRIGWYGTNYISKVQPDSVTNVTVPNDNAWHEYFLTGTCTNPDVFEVRPQLSIQHLYNSVTNFNRAFKFDDARFVRGIPDIDGDGMTDPWENSFFGSATNASPGDDPDDDTFSNWQEFLADSNPGDSNSCLEIVAVTNECGQCISFLCSPQRRYDIEFTTNPIAESWQALQSNVPGGSGGLLSVKDTNTAAGFRLYRVNLCTP